MADNHRQRTQTASTTTRHLVADGYRWTVQEMPAPTFDRRGGTHLVFDGELIMRRLRVYPTSWFELPDEDLYGLSLDMRTEKESRASE